MSIDKEVLIERKEAELLPLRLHMEALKTKFTEQTAELAVEWYRKTTKDYILKYPEITLKMSEEKISNMKTKVNELVENTEKTVQIELDNSALWWHQKPRLHDSIYQYTQVADKYPGILDRAVRHILGQLGRVLEEYGFSVTTRSNTGEYEEFWFDQIEKPIGVKQIVPCYPHLLRWTEEMQYTIQEYNAQFTKAMIVYCEIQQLKEEKKRQEALTRWDSI